MSEEKRKEVTYSNYLHVNEILDLQNQDKIHHHEGK